MAKPLNLLILIFSLVFLRASYLNASHLLCYYYQLHQDPDADKFGTWEGWLYAKDASGDYVQLKGPLEDGFVVSSKTNQDLQNLCRNLIKKEAGNQFGLLKMTTGSLFSEKSIAFSDSDVRLIAFGDSLSDDGNIRRFTRLWPINRYFMGRFSNGPIWTDYLPFTMNASVLNWGYAGGTAVLTQSGIKDPVEWVKDFIKGHSEDYVSSYIKGLTSGSILASDKDVFLFWFGSNDLSKGHSAEQVATAIENQIKRIASLGGKRFAVIGLLDFSKSPRKNTEGILLEGHSEQILKTIEKLNQSHTNIQVAYIDIHRAQNRIFNNQAPSIFEQEDSFFDYEIQHEDFSACFHGSFNNDHEHTCPYLKRAFFYDDIHPTTFGHCWFSLFIHEGLYLAGFTKQKPDLEVYNSICLNKNRES